MDKGPSPIKSKDLINYSISGRHLSASGTPGEQGFNKIFDLYQIGSVQA